jgi:hypothetical protein
MSLKVRRLLPHAVFAAVLVAALAARLQAAAAPPDDASLFERGIVRVAESQGWRLSESVERVGAPSRARDLQFDAPNCPQPIKVGILMWTFEDEAFLAAEPPPDFQRRFIYFDRSWDTPRRAAVFIEGIKNRALAVVGLAEFPPSPYLMVVESPTRCSSVERVDWSPAWRPENAPGASPAA